MSVETFVNYRRFLWLWVSSIFLISLCLIYLLHRPAGGHSGDTFYGYSLGVVATAGIIYLMWYGVRKRSYHSHRTTLKGWLAAHIWVGLALLLIVPLHAGFSFSFNLHSIAYYLMVIVILSGIWGAINYRRLASTIKSHRGGAQTNTQIEQVHLLSDNIHSLTKEKSSQFLHFAKSVDFRFTAKLKDMIFSAPPRPIAPEEVRQQIKSISESERDDALALLELAEKKRKLMTEIQQELKTMAKLKLWLLFHLPFSIALLFAVAIHIFAVFYYR